ncbi:MAG: CapA family protein [Gemmatimonadales bacterium]
MATTLMLTGDVMLGRGIDQILRQSVDPVIYEPYVKSADGYVKLAEQVHGPLPRQVAPGYVWGDSLELLTRIGPHARVINLETAVTTASVPWPEKGIQYRMHPANVEVLQAAGIHAAVLANNHVLDWGEEGLLETLETLQRAGIRTPGGGRDSEEALAPAVITVPDGRILVLAAAEPSSGVPLAWGALPHRPGIHLLPDLSRRTALELAERVRSLTRIAGDRVVGSIHWGGNWGYPAPGEQERFARVLIEEGGVDVVHGHSSHHPKGIELHRGRLILYGAGDLINDYEGIGGYESFRTELALIYLVTLQRSGEFESLTLLPFRMERFRLNRATEDETLWLLNLVRGLSRGLFFELTEDGLIKVSPA